MSALLVHSIAELRQRLAQIRRPGVILGLVPTMGALHEGHGRLIQTARGECGCVAVSIFVNPIQFDQQSDFDRYPRTLPGDLDFCNARGVDIVFAPGVEEMYSRPQRTFVDVTGLSEHLCGRFRPGHFRGVATVVAKLFHIVEPDRAYFGEKDAQQLAIIRRMTEDLNLPVRVVGVPTVREADGLALSSRNQRLSAYERRAAPALYQALLAAVKAISGGELRASEIKKAALGLLEQHPLIRTEYLEIVDPEEMQPVDSIAGPVRVAAAVWLGSTRLIDNILVE